MWLNISFYKHNIGHIKSTYNWTTAKSLNQDRTECQTPDSLFMLVYQKPSVILKHSAPAHLAKYCKKDLPVVFVTLRTNKNMNSKESIQYFEI